ncbi:MAG: hypothetical protein H3C47_07605 [Candidatus Cloacimonetes bacterium]|nr:hypothetical protein [Candidatus Cloacimonadota bacterium]
MISVYLAKTNSISGLGRTINTILDSLCEGRGVFDFRDSVVACTMKNEVPGRIPWDWIENFHFENKIVKNGPVEARIAYMAASDLLKDAPESFADSHSGLFCGTMNNGYGMVGLRNGYRICATPELKYDKSHFEKRIGTGFSYVHPMVPVYKIPNNVVANIALDYGIGGDNANFFGEDSSGVALMTAWERVKHGLLNKALVFTANHLFLNYLDYLMIDARDIFRRSFEFTPDTNSFSFPSESASACIVSTKEELQRLGLKTEAEIIAISQCSLLEEFYQRNASVQDIKKVIQKALNMAGIQFGDLDAVVFDNLEKSANQVIALKEMKDSVRADTHLCTPSLFTGHSICAHAQFQVMLAARMLGEGRYFGSYLKPTEGILSQTGYGALNTIGVLNQSYNNSLQFVILRKSE